MQPSANPTRKLLTVREAAAYLGVSKSWLDKQHLVGGFVPYVKIGRTRPRRLSVEARPTHEPSHYLPCIPRHFENRSPINHGEIS